MTTEKLRIPGLSDDEHEALNGNLEQLRAKQSRNLLRAGLYDGKHAVRQIGTIVPPTYYQTAVVLGWPAKAVDLLAQRMNVDGFFWPDGDGRALPGRAPSGAPPAAAQAELPPLRRRH